MRLHRITPWCVLAGVAVAGWCAACAHLPTYAQVGPGVSPTPTGGVVPSPAGSMPPGPCASPASNATAFIVMSVTVTPTQAPSYGPINGYALVNPDGSYPAVAGIIALHTTDIVQFVNVDNFSGVTIPHSAVGFPGAATFPPVPYAFPPAAAGPVGTTIGATLWSTGRLAAVCYSQAFALNAGTYVFGDEDYYNLSNMRDVLVVQTGAADRHAARFRPPLNPHIMQAR